jgi:hypothetical protein
LLSTRIASAAFEPRLVNETEHKIEVTGSNLGNNKLTCKAVGALGKYWTNTGKGQLPAPCPSLSPPFDLSEVSGKPKVASLPIITLIKFQGK